MKMEERVSAGGVRGGPDCQVCTRMGEDGSDKRRWAATGGAGGADDLRPCWASGRAVGGRTAVVERLRKSMYLGWQPWLEAGGGSG